ncbi:hypothetical protein [Lacinutrix sp. Bg11-31]|uniref:hypothetical protein n=1 Tax=Lacinutrix sp. Bg11-31 TaxID=2057808 RepID=UPI0018E274B8|nr:hypothetical protein [Lacinutrix sp. Bg11-31]
MTLLISNIPCWLIPLLVGAICGILGYLLGRLLGGNNNETNNEVDVDVYKNRISKLEADLAACKANKKSTFSGGNSSGGGTATSAASFAAGVVSGKSSGITAVAFDGAAAKAVFGKKVNQDDLTVVEGIGPKIKELFHNHDVTTWAGLADCSVDKCQEVLKSGGKRFEIHKPGTWPEQSKMAALGQWQKLKDWQDALDGGK